MAVNLSALRNELSNYGNLEFCDINNHICFVVSLKNSSTTSNVLKGIIENYILSDYPNLQVFDFTNNNLKCQYDKIQ